MRPLWSCKGRFLGNCKEIGCPDYKAVKALAAAYELQDYLANRIAREPMEVTWAELAPEK